MTTLDSQPATINVGQITARPGDLSQNATTTTQGINEVQVGLVLGVTPHVKPDGVVIMEVNVEKSRLGDANDSVTINGNKIQNINNVTAETTVSARSGQTIVFAGLIETTKETTLRGIPFISDIPVIGRLFEYETRQRLAAGVAGDPDAARHSQRGRCRSHPHGGVGTYELVPVRRHGPVRRRGLVRPPAAHGANATRRCH